MIVHLVSISILISIFIKSIYLVEEIECTQDFQKKSIEVITKSVHKKKLPPIFAYCWRKGILTNQGHLYKTAPLDFKNRSQVKIRLKKLLTYEIK